MRDLARVLTQHCLADFLAKADVGLAGIDLCTSQLFSGLTT